MSTLHDEKLADDVKYIELKDFDSTTTIIEVIQPATTISKVAARLGLIARDTTVAGSAVHGWVDEQFVVVTKDAGPYIRDAQQ